MQTQPKNGDVADSVEVDRPQSITTINYDGPGEADVYLNQLLPLGALVHHLAEYCRRKSGWKLAPVEIWGEGQRGPICGLVVEFPSRSIFEDTVKQLTQSLSDYSRLRILQPDLFGNYRSVRVSCYRPVRRGSLAALVSVQFASGVTITEIRYFRSWNKRWVTPPGRPIKGPRGAIVHKWLIQFASLDQQNEFQRLVLAAIDRFMRGEEHCPTTGGEGQ